MQPDTVSEMPTKRTSTATSYGAPRIESGTPWVVLLTLDDDGHTRASDAGDLMVPSECAVRVDDPEMPFLVDLTIVVPLGRGTRSAYASRVEVLAREEGVAVDGNALRRVRVGDYVRGALRSQARTMSGAPVTAAQVEAWEPYLKRGGQSGPSDEVLQNVADLYRKALSMPEHRNAPTKYVREQGNFSKGSAARYVKLARDRKFLGPALDRRAGEAK